MRNGLMFLRDYSNAVAASRDHYIFNHAFGLVRRIRHNNNYTDMYANVRLTEANKYQL